ncbi:MAG: type I-E CRISPR-associated protein Cas6/Cse3/CasE [Verrucomicrobiaceae bacterium]|nr:MAG: type I-E CRISPR-associated protein Cas6/Cse3/CasE [Verrucomicrobiaceae bacterium]
MTPLLLTQALVPYDIAARWDCGRGFADSYAWHQRVWDAFPGRGDAPRDFLTRLDDRADGFRLLILSAHPPVRPDWCPVPNWQTKTIPEAFLSHPRYEFSLVANPARKVRSNTKGELLNNSRRVAIVHREDQEVDGKPQAGLLSWLSRQGIQHGFSLPQLGRVSTIPRPRRYFLKKNQPGLHAATEFQGVLEVTDPTAFRHAFTGGIGSARAFGFGMLCLAPSK